MTVKIKTTFTNRFAPDQKVEIVTAVTDRMEERMSHKKSYGAMRNVEKFDRDHKRVGEWHGQQVLLWTSKTEYVKDEIFVVSYTNSRNQESCRKFKTAEAAAEFTRTLDERIERGSCGGYICTKM